MKKTIRKVVPALLSIVLLLGACAPKADDFLLPASGDASSKGSYLSGVELVDLKKFAAAKVTFDRAVYMEGGDDALFAGGMAIPAMLDAHGGELFMYRNYPQDLAVAAGDFVRTADAQKQVEVYDKVTAKNLSGAPTRVIDLQGLDGKHVVAYDIVVDANGISLYLTTCDFNADSTPNFATGEEGVYLFDMDGALISSQPASLSQGHMPLNLIRAGSESFLLVDDILRPEAPSNMSAAEAAIYEMQQQDYRRLCAVNADRGTFAPFVREGMENMALLGAMSYPDGRILCVDFVVKEADEAAACAVQISLYNPADNETEILTYAYTAANEYFAPQMSYDETTDTLFFFRNNELRAWQLSTIAPIAQLTVVDRVQIYDDLCAIDGTLLYMVKNMQVELFSKLTLPKGMPLALSEEEADTIAYGIGQNLPISILASKYEGGLSFDSPFGNGAEVLKYIERYCSSQNRQGFTLVPTFLGDSPTGIEVAGNDAMYTYMDTVAKKLLAGDDDFDLFFIGGRSYKAIQTHLNGMVKNGYLYPLNELGLAPLFDEMLPGVKGLCSDENGQILLVPVSLDFDKLELNPDILQAIGVTPDDIPRAAAEFIEFVDTYSDAITDAEYIMFNEAGTFNMYRAAEHQYVAQYYENEGNTQEMWDMFTALLKTIEAHTTDASGRNVPDLFFNRYNTNGIFGMRTKWNYLEGDSTRYMPTVPVPLLTEDAKYPLYESIFIGVNPNSKNLDAVAEFLNTYLSREYIDYALEQSQMLKSWDEFNKSGSEVHVWTALYDLPQLDPELYPAFVYYKEMLQNATRGYPGYISFRMFDEFMAGEVSSEAWKQDADRELEFLRDE